MHYKLQTEERVLFLAILGKAVEFPILKSLHGIVFSFMYRLINIAGRSSLKLVQWPRLTDTAKTWLYQKVGEVFVKLL